MNEYLSTVGEFKTRKIPEDQLDGTPLKIKFSRHHPCLRQWNEYTTIKIYSRCFLTQFRKTTRTFCYEKNTKVQRKRRKSDQFGGAESERMKRDKTD